jgi:hypothetical protein
MRRSLVIVLTLLATLAWSQESALHADFVHEGDRVSKACGSFSFKVIPGCAYQLFTDHPLHIAVGSIAPQNGFGFGAALVGHHTPNENWRISYDVDAIASTSAAWRAGAYIKMIHTPPVPIVVDHSSSSKKGAKKKPVSVRQYTVFNLYAQAISLNELYFFGLGPNSTLAGQSVFGMRESILGGNVVKPVQSAGRLNLALLGEANGRFVSLRGNHQENRPSIEQAYNEASAPGLRTQPGFLQLGEGVRIKPILFNDHVQLNYLGSFQQFFAPSNSHYSFLRWTADLGHTFPLYGITQSAAPKDTNGPDECATGVGADKCPPVSKSRNRSGAIGARLLLSESWTSGSSVVPFYFQPTLGGSDVNGTPTLGAYQDYRFRGPNLLLIRESLEHSIWGPFGFQFLADQGKVALTRSDIDFSHLRHSYAAGFTIRAGGLPEIFFLYAWGAGSEGDHKIFYINPSLLGGSYRPSLY